MSVRDARHERVGAPTKAAKGRAMRYRGALCLAAVLAVALLARLPYVTARSIWFDETASWQTARLGPLQLLEVLQVDTTMPPYYFVLKGWLAVFGDSPLSLRLSSIVFGVLAVAGMYLFGIELYIASRASSAPRCRRRAGSAEGFGLAVALAIALSPFQINAAIEARMYALGTAVTAFAGWALLRALRRVCNWRWWLIYSGLAGFDIGGIVILPRSRYFICGMTAALCCAGCHHASDRELFQAAVEAVRSGESEQINTQSHHDIGDEDLKPLAELTSLRSLSLDEARITDAALSCLGGLPQLQFLSLSKTRITNDGVKRLKGLKSLDSLRLDCVHISDDCLEDIANLRTVSRLSLWKDYITDDGLAVIGTMSQLRTLSLDETQITDAGLKHLYGLKNLVYCSVWKTAVTDKGVEQLQIALPKLRVNQ